ncbi:S26 family signal peptidase [Halobacteriales archaeon QS_1_68_17]|nr:MAG: S26 family signal peptidase [Halobacteriales archaeon QS_1_68_17]
MRERGENRDPDHDHDHDRGPPDRSGDGSGVSDGVVAFLQDFVTSALAVLAVGVLLFAVSGVWPPLVAIESHSMTPNIQKGDLVFVMEEQRFPGEGHHSGVVTAETGAVTSHTKFHRAGDVIIYRPDGSRGATPIIHRAMFWVNESENWYDKAEGTYVGDAENCEQLRNCPAPHGGFVTLGDSRFNDRYDQVAGLSEPVRPAWIIGTAEFRIPALGWVRLGSGGIGAAGATPVEPAADVTVVGSTADATAGTGAIVDPTAPGASATETGDAATTTPGHNATVGEGNNSTVSDSNATVAGSAAAT